MPTDKQWTMNCILFGAKLVRILKKQGRKAGREALLSLSSGLTPEDADYLIDRLEK